jgi:hypothetical protein
MFLGVMLDFDTFVDDFSKSLPIQFLEVDQMHALPPFLELSSLHPALEIISFTETFFQMTTSYMRKSGR